MSDLIDEHYPFTRDELVRRSLSWAIRRCHAPDPRLVPPVPPTTQRTPRENSICAGSLPSRFWSGQWEAELELEGRLVNAPASAASRSTRATTSTSSSVARSSCACMRPTPGCSTASAGYAGRFSEEGRGRPVPGTRDYRSPPHRRVPGRRLRTRLRRARRAPRSAQGHCRSSHRAGLAHVREDTGLRGDGQRGRSGRRD
jgi:hypothetical protein